MALRPNPVALWPDLVEYQGPVRAGPDEAFGPPISSTGSIGLPRNGHHPPLAFAAGTAAEGMAANSPLEVSSAARAGDRSAAPRRSLRWSA